MNIKDNRGIIVGPNGKIQGDASVSNTTSKDDTSVMNNTFNAPVGNVGQKVADVIVNQNVAPSLSFDLGQLASELSQIRAAAKLTATQPEHDSEIGAVGEAEVAARKDDREGVRNALAKVGPWIVDVGTKISAGLAVEAIKHSTGL